MSMFGRCVLLASLFSGFPQCHTGSNSPSQPLDSLLQNEGFTPLTPPDESAGPGAIIVVGSDGSVTLVCSATQSLGPDYTPESSPTASLTSQTSTSGGLSLSGSLSGYFSGSVDLSSVQDIDVSLGNAFVLSASEADIVDNSANRDPGCSTAVSTQPAGTTLSYVTQVYEADFTATVQFKSGVSADVQAQITSAIAVQLGGSSQVSGNGSITGTGLYWGFRSQPM
jgi:hypothetical protein